MPRKTYHKKSKKAQKIRKTMRKMHGGNCGCGCQAKPFFGGANAANANGTVFGGIYGPVSGAVELSKLSPALVKGGSPFGAPSFDGKLSIANYYPLNKYDPDVQHMQEASRLNPNMLGGASKKKGRKGRKSRKNKKIRGGSASSLLFSVTDPIYQSASNAVSSVGNVSGALLQSNIIQGIPSSSYNPTFTNPVIKQYV